MMISSVITRSRVTRKCQIVSFGEASTSVTNPHFRSNNLKDFNQGFGWNSSWISPQLTQSRSGQPLRCSHHRGDSEGAIHWSADATELLAERPQRRSHITPKSPAWMWRPRHKSRRAGGAYLQLWGSTFISDQQQVALSIHHYLLLEPPAWGKKRVGITQYCSRRLRNVSFMSLCYTIINENAAITW